MGNFLIIALVVALAGALGSVLRFALGWAISLYGWSWPWATLLVNFIGSLLIGLLIGNTSQGSMAYYFGVVGFCGGFTTFSAFSLEVVRLLRQGDVGLGLLYVGVSLMVCLAAVYIGLKIKLIN